MDSNKKLWLTSFDNHTNKLKLIYIVAGFENNAITMVIPIRCLTQGKYLPKILCFVLLQ